MNFYLSFGKLHVVQKSKQVNYISKLSSENKILSSLVKKAYFMWTCLNHLRKASKQ